MESAWKRYIVRMTLVVGGCLHSPSTVSSPCESPLLRVLAASHDFLSVLDRQHGAMPLCASRHIYIRVDRRRIMPLCVSHHIQF